MAGGGQGGGGGSGGVNTSGRYPMMKPLNPEEQSAWAKFAIGRCREFGMAHVGMGDGYAYFIFQDAPHGRGGMQDLHPFAGRVPIQVLASMVQRLAQLGGQVKVQAAPGGGPGGVGDVKPDTQH